MTEPNFYSYFNHVAKNESGGSNTAKNPFSSAEGKYQFLKGTWEGLMASHPELRLTVDGRSDPLQQDKAMVAFTADNARALQSGGLEPTPGNLYAAHFLGAGGARKVLSQPDITSMDSLVSPEVLAANPLLKGMTVADFKGWTSKHSGEGAPLAPDGSYDITVPEEHLAPTDASGRHEELRSILAPLIQHQLSQKYDLTPVDYDPWAVQAKGETGG